MMGVNLEALSRTLHDIWQPQEAGAPWVLTLIVTAGFCLGSAGKIVLLGKDIFNDEYRNDVTVYVLIFFFSSCFGFYAAWFMTRLTSMCSDPDSSIGRQARLYPYRRNDSGKFRFE